jgi:signal transduction histidine kinase
MGADLRRQVFLIFKEGVTNIVSHSDCTEARIKFSVERECLWLNLSDNGRGFDPTQVKNGNGLKNIRERVKNLGGRIEITSHPGRATTLELSVPLVRMRFSNR